MFGRLTTRQIRNVAELAQFVEANPDMKIARLATDDLGNLTCLRKRVGKRCFLMRNRAQEADAQRWNNWKVGVALRAMGADPAQNKTVEWKCLFGLNEMTTKANKRFAELHCNSTGIQLSKIYFAVKEYKMPLFETSQYRKYLDSDIIPYYTKMASKGEYVVIAHDGEDAFLGHSAKLAIPAHNLRVDEFTHMQPKPMEKYPDPKSIDAERISMRSVVAYQDVEGVPKEDSLAHQIPTATRHLSPAQRDQFKKELSQRMLQMLLHRQDENKRMIHPVGRYVTIRIDEDEFKDWQKGERQPEEWADEPPDLVL